MPLAPPYNKQERAVVRLKERAKRSVAEGKQNEWPEVVIPEGLQHVVPIETYLLHLGKTMRSYQKKVNRLNAQLRMAERLAERRKESLVKAANYIDDLKKRKSVSDSDVCSAWFFDLVQCVKPKGHDGPHGAVVEYYEWIGERQEAQRVD